MKKSDYIVICILMGGHFLYDCAYPSFENKVYHDLSAAIWSFVNWGAFFYILTRISTIINDRLSTRVIKVFSYYFGYRAFINVAVALRCLKEILFNDEGSHEYYRLMRSNYYLDFVTWLLIAINLIYLLYEPITKLILRKWQSGTRTGS